MENHGSPKPRNDRFESPLINTNKVLIPPKKGEMLYHTENDRLIAKLPTQEQKEKT